MITITPHLQRERIEVSVASAEDDAHSESAGRKAAAKSLAKCNAKGWREHRSDTHGGRGFNGELGALID